MHALTCNMCSLAMQPIIMEPHPTQGKSRPIHIISGQPRPMQGKNGGKCLMQDRSTPWGTHTGCLGNAPSLPLPLILCIISHHRNKHKHPIQGLVAHRRTALLPFSPLPKIDSSESLTTPIAIQTMRRKKWKQNNIKSLSNYQNNQPSVWIRPQESPSRMLNADSFWSSFPFHLIVTVPTNLSWMRVWQ